MSEILTIKGSCGIGSLNIQPSHKEGVMEIRTNSSNDDGFVVGIDRAQHPKTYEALVALHKAVGEEGERP